MRTKVQKLGRETFASLKIRNYRLFFLSQGLSLTGNWMQQISQGILVLQLTHSGTALGIVTACQFIPVLLLGPWAGVMIDRFPKIKILYLTQIINGILALALGLLVLTNQIQIWMVYVIATGLGLMNTLDNPARQTFVLEMVGKDNLRNAVSLNSSMFNLARVIGPAVAGALIATVGLAICFLINAFSYIPVIIALSMMRTGELHTSELVPKAKGQITEGFRYIQSNPLLKNTLIMMAIVGTLTYEFSVSLPLLSQFTFQGDASSYAALTSAMGLGSLIGGLFTASRTKKTSSKMLVTACFLFGLSVLLVSIAPNLLMAIFAMVIVGFFSLNFTSLGNVTLQLEADSKMRGRVMALWTVAFLGSTPIGGPIIGWAGEHLGPRYGLVIGGTAAIVAAGYGYVTLVRRKYS